VRGRTRINIVLVALLAVRQRGDGKGGAALRGVFGANKFAETAVCGKNVVVDRVIDLLRQTLLVIRGNT